MSKDEDLQVNCPHCRKAVHWAGNPFRPFCSERCRLIDLGCWADEDYRIAGKEAPKEEEGKVIPFPKNQVQENE
jgi:uncharacterized protein